VNRLSRENIKMIASEKIFLRF